ncbi:MAG: winged helix-turn-helix transcriptional regulator [Hyphomicrobiaceae bacterium]
MRLSDKLVLIDVKILAELQKNGRITNARVSEAIGFSLSSCLQRLNRLEMAGHISGVFYHLLEYVSALVGGCQITIERNLL